MILFDGYMTMFPIIIIIHGTDPGQIPAAMCMSRCSKLPLGSRMRFWMVALELYFPLICSEFRWFSITVGVQSTHTAKSNVYRLQVVVV